MNCSSINNPYLLFSCLLILSMAFGNNLPLKYVISPSCNMLHSIGSTIFLTFIVHLKIWSSSSIVCDHSAHLLLWKVISVEVISFVHSFTYWQFHDAMFMQPLYSWGPFFSQQPIKCSQCLLLSFYSTFFSRVCPYGLTVR